MAPFKSNELKSDWRSDFLTEETDCDCEGCGQDPCIKCGESHHSINEELQGGVSVETYTKDTKFTEIETVDIIKTEPLKSTSITEEVLVEDFMTNLYNEGYSVDEINEYLLEEYEIEEEYLEEVWGILAKGALKGAKLLTKGAGYAAKRTVKDSGKVAKFVKNPKNWSRANKDLDKVGGALVKGAKDTKELAARTYAAGQKARKIVDAGGKNLLGPAKSFKKLTSDFKKSQEAATRAINIEKIRATKPVVTTVKAPTNVGKVELPKINWKPTTPKGGTATATKPVETVKQITTSQPNKGLNAKFSKAKIRHRGMQELDRTQKANTLSSRISKGYDKSLEKTGDKIIKDIKATPIPKNKAIVKSPSGSLAKSTDKGSALTKTAPDKGSALTKTAPDKGSALTKTAPDKGSTLTKTQSTALSKTDDKGSALAKRKDNVKRAVAAVSFATGSAGGVEVSKKLGLINKKEKNESFSDWRSDLEVVDESVKVMLKVGKRVWKTPGVKKFLSKVPSNLSRTTKIKPLTKSHSLIKKTSNFSVPALDDGAKAGEVFGPGRSSLKLRSDIGRPKPKNMALNTETGDYVTKLKKSNYELVPGAKYGDKVMAKNYGQERFEKKFRESIKKAQEKLKTKEEKGPIRLKDIFGDGSTQPKGIKDKRGTNQAALKILKKSDSDK